MSLVLDMELQRHVICSFQSGDVKQFKEAFREKLVNGTMQGLWQYRQRAVHRQISQPGGAKVHLKHNITKANDICKTIR